MNVRLLALASLAALSMTMIAPPTSADGSDLYLSDNLNVALPDSDSRVTDGAVNTEADSVIVHPPPIIYRYCYVAKVTVYGQTIYILGIAKVQTYDRTICV